MTTEGEAKTTTRAGEVFAVFLRLGLTSFGGPIAHLGYFRGEFVGRRRWLDDAAYADLVAFCQFLPGPASSQVAMAIGLRRAGLAGLLAAFVAFTLPSALMLAALALLSGSLVDATGPGLLRGLMIAAVAAVASALIGMARSLAPDAARRLLALATAVFATLMPNALGQVAVLVAGALFGLMRGGAPVPQTPPVAATSPRVAVAALGLFALILAGLPLVAGLADRPWLSVADTFYRAGSLVFGGGHVVLPLLEADLVPRFIDADGFLAGYGAAQAVPGPLFSFSAYVGARVPGGLAGAGLVTFAMFLPSMLLVVGALPFWERLKSISAVRAMLAGVNAAVVGLIAAAFVHPVLTAGVTGPADAALALAGLLALETGRVPAWAVVAACAAVGLLVL